MRLFPLILLILVTALTTAAFIVLNPAGLFSTGLEKAGFLDLMRGRYAITEATDEQSALTELTDAITTAIESGVAKAVPAPAPPTPPPVAVPEPAPAPAPPVPKRPPPAESERTRMLISRIDQTKSENKILTIRIAAEKEKAKQANIKSGKARDLERDMQENNERIRDLEIQLETEKQRLKGTGPL